MPKPAATTAISALRRAKVEVSLLPHSPFHRFTPAFKIFLWLDLKWWHHLPQQREGRQAKLRQQCSCAVGAACAAGERGSGPGACSPCGQSELNSASLRWLRSLGSWLVTLPPSSACGSTPALLRGRTTQSLSSYQSRCAQQRPWRQCGS
jgi:hypothetical protein